VLVFAVYYRRHRRRDLVVAFLGINVGVLAVSAVLGTAEIAMGLGLGLFGVLSIIRLRSDEISQREVAYYFAALAMGLIAGLSSASVLLPSLLIALIVVVMWIADHPALLARSRHQTVRLDRAIANEHELRAELEAQLGGTVTSVTVQHLDLVNDSTLVDVRYRVNVQPADALPGERAPHDGIRALSATRRTTTATASSPAPVPRTRTAGAVR
jgi:Ca2+/Na+ antiporter